MPRFRARGVEAQPSTPRAIKTGRYTPPQPKTKKHSPLWVGATMFACFGAGMVVLLANYLQLLPGGEAQSSDLFLGLGLMIGGFGLSTQLR